MPTWLLKAGALVAPWAAVLLGQGSLPPESTSPIGLRALDIEGRLHVLGEDPRSRGFCLVVLGIDCPMAMESLPELDRLSRLARALGIDLFGVLSDPFATLVEARRLWDATRPSFPLLFDSNGVLARRLHPEKTPEAYLFDAHGKPVYRGRIDDRGRFRIGANVAQRRDLQEAIEALSKGKLIPVTRTGPIGCAYEGWPEPEDREVTWSRNVAPIVDLHCIGCHSEGGSAPFGLERYEDAARRSKMVAQVAVQRTMPRWHAVPGFGDLRGERSLDVWEVRTLETWSSSGAKRGEESEALRCVLQPKGELESPDLALDAPPVVVPPDGPDWMQETPLAAGLSEDVYVRAIDFRFSDPRLVRSAAVFLNEPGAVGGGQDATASADEDRGPRRRAVATWLPGRVAEPLPDGIGHALRTTDEISLWVHLHPHGQQAELRASVAMWFAAAPVGEVVVLCPLETTGATPIVLHEGYGLRFEHRFEAEGRVLAILPRLGSTGSQLKAVVRSASSPEIPLVWVHRWDPYWAERYGFRRPIELPGDSVLEIEASFHDPEASEAPFLTPPDLLSRPEGERSAIAYLELAVSMRSRAEAR